jgi:bifunctional oligoribonuclease and PAP phosphatase NrnA
MSSRQTNSNGTSDLRRVAEAVRAHDRFLITTHENPDGDSLGSILAMKLALEQLGKDCVLYLSGATPLPTEYRFMPLEAVQRTFPADAAERVVLALDCANKRRIGPDETLLDRSPLVIDIDHHHDNTRFGDVNVIVPTASSTGEVLRDLFRELDVELTPEIAEALSIALVTDTGRRPSSSSAAPTFTVSFRSSTRTLLSRSSSFSPARWSAPASTRVGG